MKKPSTPLSLPQNFLAQALDFYQQGDLRSAQECCQTLMPTHSANNALRSLMGAIELGLNNAADAIAHFSAATQLDPYNADTWYSLAVALHRAMRLAEARANYEHALRINLNHAAALENLGAVCQQLGEYTHARDHLKRAVLIKPQQASCHWNLALVYEKLNDHTLELKHLQRAVELEPRQIEWSMRYASKLRCVDLIAAEKLCRHILVTTTENADAWTLLGTIQLAQRQFDAARVSFERSIQLNANHAYAHYNLAYVLLLTGDFINGWREFAWRKKRPDFINGTTPPPANVPEWAGEPLVGKHLLLKCEQGLGDTVMFARFVAPLSGAGATVTLECPEHMSALLKTTTGIARVIEQYQPDSQYYDYHAWLLDVPRCLHILPDVNMPAPPYLAIDSVRATRWRKRLTRGDSLRVGLVWRGNPNNPLDVHRSIAPELLSALSNSAQIEFFMLQKNATSTELAALSRHIKLRVLDDPVDEDGKFLDTAAILAQLDLLISVDTAVAHLAGALGLPVWLLVAAQQDWRWGVAASSTPWYPTMTLYRQEHNDWHPTLARLRQDLLHLYERKESLNETATAIPPQLNTPSSATRPQSHHDALLEQGLAALRAGDVARAETYLANIPSTHPNYAAVLNYRAVIALQSGAAEQALVWLKDAVTRAPNFSDAHVNLARTLQEKGDTNTALQHYHAALAAQPDHAVAHANLGSLYHEQRQLDDAIKHYRHASRVAPDFAVPPNNLGVIALERGQYDEAVQLFERALRLDPHFSDAWCNLGNTYKSMGRMNDARRAYDTALQHDTSHAGAHWNRALLLLLQSAYLQAWPDYAWGYAARERTQRRFPFDQWRSGTSIAQSVFVFPEEGVGDEVFYARFIPTLIARCRRVVVECDPRLQNLLSHSFPQATFLAKNKNQRLPEIAHLGQIDLALGANDIMQALNITAPTIPTPAAFLRPDDALRQTWKARLGEIKANRRIGIAWRGGKDPQLQRERSLPLASLQPLFTIPGIAWINLQYGDHNEEIAAIQKSAGVTLHHYSDINPLIDLEHYTAMIANLDLVISIDNSTVHFSNALNVPTWVMLSMAPEWRWGLHSEAVAWHPCARLFRQHQLHRWDSVIQRIRQALLEQ